MLRNAALKSCLFAIFYASSFSFAASISGGQIHFDDATGTYNVSNNNQSFGIHSLGSFSAHDPASGSLNATTLELNLVFQGDLYGTSGVFTTSKIATDLGISLWVQNETPPAANVSGSPILPGLIFDTSEFVISSTSTSSSLMADFDLSDLNHNYNPDSMSHMVLSAFGYPMISGNVNLDLIINGTAELIFDVDTTTVTSVPLSASLFFFLPVILAFLWFRISRSRAQAREIKANYESSPDSSCSAPPLSPSASSSSS
ncbi:MAG: hypothetical protein COA42_06490 [Alteromonadaceae bacterium]|nr:MAG: hypothetical protein COA42_06490 [Alteromonadaceae bacterium]